MFNFLVSVLSQEWMFVWSQPSIDVVKTTGVELRVQIVGQRMLAVGQSLSMEWQYVISLLGMAAYEMT